MRLRGIVQDVPKPMAPVADRPFLEYLILQLISWDVRDIIFSVAYKVEVIKSYFGDGSKWGVKIEYSEEKEPLGTGGALRLARNMIDDESFIVMNGDSFLEIDLKAFSDFHRKKSAIATIGIVEVDDTGRYGKIEVGNNGEVEVFAEKTTGGYGFINGGVYIFTHEVMDEIPEGKVSLESNILPCLIKKGLYGMATRGFFVDIGIPADYLGLLKSPERLLKGAFIYR